MKRNTTNKKKRFILILIGAILLAGLYLLFAWKFQYAPFSNGKSYEPGESVVNLERSQAEKKVTSALEENPEKKLENTQTDTPPAPKVDSQSGMQDANVMVTNAGIFNGTVSASGFATNVSESDGTCEFVFSGPGNTLTKTSSTMQNPTSTSCKTVSFPSSELTANGTWSVYIRYTSPVSEGKSGPREFQK